MKGYVWLRKMVVGYARLHQLTLVVLIALLAACSSGPTPDKLLSPEPIVVSGSLTNLMDTTLVFTYTPYELLATNQEVSFSVDSCGGFRLKFESAVPVKGFLSFGKVPATYSFTITQVNGCDSSLSVESVDFRMVWFWLEPGDSLNMNTDVDRIEETLSFSGTGKANNVFLNREESQFNSYKQKYLWNYYHITYCNPDDYKQRVDQLREDKLNFLHEFAAIHPLSPALITVYKSEYYTGSITRKIHYPASHEGFNQNRPVVLPGNYFEFMDGVILEPEIADKGIGYYYFLKTWLTKKREMSGMTDQDGEDFYDYVKSQIHETTAYEFMAWALARDFRKALYDQFGEDCPYPDIALKVKERYRDMEGLLEGCEAPQVTLQKPDGTSIRLDELKGSFVYIDFWATWCVPCIKEIPFLKEVENKFEGQNIQFVSISLDKPDDHEKWKNYVKTNDLSGIQLIADEETHSIFSRVWNIDLIPRFVLLDNECRIVNSNAPRPSDPKLLELFNSLKMNCYDPSRSGI